MNRNYYWLKAGLIAVAFCFAIAGSAVDTFQTNPHFSHSPFTAADRMQAGILRTGGRLSRLALKLFYFAR